MLKSSTDYHIEQVIQFSFHRPVLQCIPFPIRLLSENFPSPFGYCLSRYLLNQLRFRKSPRPTTLPLGFPTTSFYLPEPRYAAGYLASFHEISLYRSLFLNFQGSHQTRGVSSKFKRPYLPVSPNHFHETYSPYHCPPIRVHQTQSRLRFLAKNPLFISSIIFQSTILVIPQYAA